jgi:hypothetical protein
MSKERNIEILQHKIDELEIKIHNFNQFNISPKKTNKLVILKQKYEDQLDGLLQE